LGDGERRWPRGRHLVGRLAAAGESVVDVPPKLSARVRVLSSFAGNARKNDGLDALATALAASRNERLAVVDPEVGSEVLRLLSERREDLVAERTRALNRLHGLLRDLVPGGVAGTLSATRAARIVRGIRAQGASARLRRRGWLRRCCATSGRSTGRSPILTGASKPRWKPPAPPSPRSTA
jgi:transposase